MLHLVDDGAVAMRGDETAGIFGGDPATIGLFEGNVGKTRARYLAECRLAGLTRTGDGDDGIEAGDGLEGGKDVAGDGRARISPSTSQW
jgi:hypothetical protein